MKYIFIAWFTISCLMALLATTKAGLQFTMGYGDQKVIWSSPIEVALGWPIFLIHLIFTVIVKVVRV